MSQLTTHCGKIPAISDFFGEIKKKERKENENCGCLAAIAR
jgi:hypothetical protein